MKKIIEQLGPQSEEDMSFLSSQHAMNYVKDLAGKKKENESDKPALIN